MNQGLVSEYFPIKSFHPDSFYFFKPQMIHSNKIINKYAYFFLCVDFNVYQNIETCLYWFKNGFLFQTFYYENFHTEKLKELCNKYLHTYHLDSTLNILTYMLDQISIRLSVLYQFIFFCLYISGKLQYTYAQNFRIHLPCLYIECFGTMAI